jgi:pyridoxamine 5'-phosphate oxidase-like protein
MPAHTHPPEPTASRPTMPRAYGIQASNMGQGLLPWRWAADLLRRSRGYWLATTRPEGRPHVAVVWGVWRDDGFWFATSPASRKGRNLAANAQCVVCPEQTAEAVIVEGLAAPEMDPVVVTQFGTAYAAKYGEEIDLAIFQVYHLSPVVAFATISDADEFPATATRWHFAHGG